MRVVLATLGWFCIACGAALYAGQAAHLLKPSNPASLQGRVTVVETVSRTTKTNPVPNVKFYLFTLEESKPFIDLQQRCRRAMARPEADPVKTYQLCDQALAEAFKLVPRLPALAAAQTDSDGSFQFDNLEPGHRYHLVGIKPAEVGSPIVIVAKTAPLRPGEHVSLELSQNDPWTGPLELK